MERVKRFLDEEDMERLKSLKGLRLEHIRLTPPNGSDTVLQVIEFSAGSKRYYLYCDLECIDYFGLSEDISFLSFTDQRYPFIDCMEFVIEHIGLDITGVSEVKDSIRLLEGGKPCYEFSFTRGIIIHFGAYQFSIEKVSYFSELMTVRKGYDLISKFESIEEYRKDFDDECKIEVSRTVEQVC